MSDRVRLLDLTRSLRRAGRVPTGIDRVEMAYLHRFVSDTTAPFALVRSAFGYLLLDRAGMRNFAATLDGKRAFGSPSLLSRLPRGRTDIVAAAESDLRRAAIARCSARGLGGMLRRHLGRPFDYFNVGHSNLTDRVLKAVKSAGGLNHVLIHDVIPLEYPEHQRPGTVTPFRGKIARTGALADRVIYNSVDTQMRTERQFTSLGRVPPGIAAHLGTIEPQADAAALPAGMQPNRPYFITVGTIEPRKNHAFLLDLWQAWGPDAPPLLICGSRGWENHETFARLDALGPDDPVREVSGLGDAALGALVQGAHGALFPTLAEGFGLPPIEALSLGTRVLCNDLDVLREILSDHATYVSIRKPENWLERLKKWEKDGGADQRGPAFIPFSWSDHFETVLRLS
ncbi:MAG: glycosyltransferase [Sulfitobacter sp.]|nr:glycosyltransferase [Sulfitobacter sp.]